MEVVTASDDSQGLSGNFTVTATDNVGNPLSIDALEKELCQANFTWYQKVVEDSNPPKDSNNVILTAPYTDPPPNGYSDQWADSAPWYWDEAAQPATDNRDWGEHYLLKKNVKGSTLHYEDWPGGPAGTKVKFQTFLISSCSDSSAYVVLDGFYWSIEVGADGKTKVTQLNSATPVFKWGSEIKAEFGANYKSVADCCHLCSGCFIATAAYGSPLAEELDTFRGFRDDYLLTNPVGSRFVSLYYKYSPPVAEFIDDHPVLKPIVRFGLLPHLGMATIAVKTTLAQKVAILASIAFVGVLVGLWLRRRVLRR